MIDFLRKTASVFGAWPKDVASSVDYQMSRASSSGAYGEAISCRLRDLPEPALLHQAYANRSASAERALMQIWAHGSPILFVSHDINYHIGHILAEADCGALKRINPVLRRALLSLRDQLLPPEERHLKIDQHLNKRYSIAKVRFYDTKNHGQPGFGQNRSIMLLLVGLQRLMNHPQIASHNFLGATPPARSLCKDLASLVSFIVCVGALPSWLFIYRNSLRYSTGVVTLSLLAGGLYFQRKNEQVFAAHVRADSADALASVSSTPPIQAERCSTDLLGGGDIVDAA